MSAPAGVNLTISRDAFGKPTAIARSGAFNGYSNNVTRSYVYDSAQRLCKTVEPEVGATIQDYDAAGNLKWKAPGSALTTLASCDASTVPAAAKISYFYDARNRLTAVSFGDGGPGISRSYTPDGLLQTITSNGSVWTYGYNALRKLATESLSFSGQTYNIGWGYNTAGDLSSLVYPDNSAVSYNPNARGQAKNVSPFVSGISFHPNGVVSAYNLANGIAHSMTQNTRGLPLVNRDAGVMQDLYSYDANGNVTGITDQFDGGFSRSMGYDDLDRLTSASAPNVWGSASYVYDTVDNLRAATVGVRSSNFNFNSNNQLSSVTGSNGTTNYSFDPRGNLTAKGGQSFAFDLGNRLSWSSLGGSYVYDGHGRRVRVQSSDGSTRIQLYSLTGQLLWAASSGGPRPASSTSYVYLGGKQIAEVNSVNGTQYVHTDALGSPVAHTNAAGSLMNRTRFEAYGYPAQGVKPSANTSVIGFTGHVQDAETDLVYMQQRYYDPIAGRFLSVDPVVTDANTGKGFGLYTYVDNNPYAKIDPDGRDPYLVSRPLVALPCCASHNFVVSNAAYVGDPKATVHSWGNNGKDITGKVDDTTKGMSEGTSKRDKEFWSSLASDPASGKLNTTPINATDATVDKVAKGVQENTKYAKLPSTSSQSNETNSNSAASAVANKAQGSTVEVPGGGRLSPGVNQADKIKIVVKEN